MSSEANENRRVAVVTGGAGGVAGDVLIRTSESTRSGKARASSCANAPPAETPTMCPPRIPYGSSTPTASATRSLPVYAGRPSS